MSKFSLRSTIAAIALCVSAPAYSMEFSEYNLDNDRPVIIAEGEIEAGDAGKFVDFAKSHPRVGNRIILHSPGGVVQEAVLIARVLRGINFTTIVIPEGVCFSACFELWAAGTTRIAGEGARIGVHRQHVDGEETTETKAGTIDTATRLQKYGVPKSILASMLLQPAAGIYTLTDDELTTMNAKRFSKHESVTTARAAPAKPTYELTYNDTPAPAPDPQDIRAQRRAEFDDTFVKAYEVSKYQNGGRAAAVKNCDRRSCEVVLAYRDKRGYYVELHKSLTSGSRALCRLVEEGVFTDRYRCKNWLTQQSRDYEWSRDPLM